MSDTLQARVPGSSGRKPKTYGAERRCGTDGCRTILSKYNPADLCYRHAPSTFTRLRGVIGR